MNDVLCAPNELTDEQLNLVELKNQLVLFGESQKTAFLNNVSVNDLVYQRSDYFDDLLARLWQHFNFHRHPNLALVAVGGYGRRELHPLSDIDLLILSEGGIDKDYQRRISEFVTLLWDLKLEVGHAVRTLKECIDVGLDDLTVATNLQEARLLCGGERIYHELKTQIHSEQFWPSAKFFDAKVKEQKERHARYHDTAYNLEPDIKSSPGGLRDIHTLSWIARRHFGATSLREMSKYGFLTDAEFRELDECQTMLWRIRFALHLELRRYDNRLTFSHQPSVAETLSYKGDGNRGIELMMKDFYRTLGRVSELNKMLIRLFEIAIQDEPNSKKIEVLSDDFQRRGRQIEARKPALFQARPETIIDMFLHIANDKSIESISAPTLRQLRTARRRLNRFLCDIPEAKEKFIDLTRHPNALHKAFSLMHKHGVLSAYLPQWSQIVGQMQFDLFHAYTVDEHTIRLLKHINSYSQEENRDKHPICCDVYPRLAKPELLLLAAMFHDIGKGRGGDHSVIGAEEAYAFCIEHDFSRPEANLVSWLVGNHLLMSVTAQRRDIYDPEVITEFAQKVRDEERLDYLICLTVADINATNPELWNSWKRTLLAELYYSTQKALRRGLENPPDMRERIRHNQHLASALLRKHGHTPRDIELLWQRFKADYFLRHTHKQIAWHSEHILNHSTDEPLVLVSKNATRGGTEIFVYSQDKASLFARVVASLDKKNLSVQDAQIMTSKDGFALDTFMVLDANNDAISLDRHEKIREGVTNALMQDGAITIPVRRAPRKLMAFNVKTQVTFLPTRTGRRTLLELVALDTPGLLARVGAVLARQNVSLQAAKITTIGERAEDFFIVTDGERQSLTEDAQQALREALFDAINDAS
ncbi:bifunctional uridylyltransferase/uridylyl-removing protein GlnD [Enterovibrio sp. ZSDZ42]|uniref:Bifunctional uridylyltransferase/uridylyl-removing enzyme n=1 Tax=Enterovibrio gelatinilyticus TaxID=2899819 RepID=A0ABT5R4P3_9GAMM|nr:bifunctional uridylyltransferase/uridylyl-removing protein GlnD [Enterovibrio sp. ZSDZ42]MDD1795238.1 bifunctional uridylyltransferase/uridylyl-removing protein GlnD [Enterovibrio sp. ZSDZ42]